MINIKIDNIPNLNLTAPNPERDAPYVHNWFTSEFGKETLLLMGNAENEIKPSTLESEKATLQKFIEQGRNHEQLTWMIRERDKTIGAVWIELVDTPEVKSPAIHIMIGDKDYRGQGIGKIVMSEMIQYTKNELNLHDIYSRHLTNNGAAAALLDSLGFSKDGDVYMDDNKLVWQNVYLNIDNESMLEITDGLSCLGLLERSNDQFGLFPDSEFISMDFLLSIGDISHLDDLTDRHTLDIVINMKNRVSEFNEKIKKHNKIRIWTSLNNSEDYLSTLYVLHLLKKRSGKMPEVYIIDASQVPINDKTPDINTWNVTCFSENEVKNLLKYEEKLSADNINSLLNIWNDLVQENSPLRICNNNHEIKSVNLDYFDNIILDKLRESGETSITAIIGDITDNYLYEGGDLGCLFYHYRINELIKGKKIRVVKRDEESFYRSTIVSIPILNT